MDLDGRSSFDELSDNVVVSMIRLPTFALFPHEPMRVSQEGVVCDSLNEPHITR
jgi:hypothetical protein